MKLSNIVREKKVFLKCSECDLILQTCDACGDDFDYLNVFGFLAKVYHTDDGKHLCEECGESI